MACVLNFFNKVGLYFGVKGNLHNDECLIKIFTEKFEYGTLIIFNKTLYHSCYK